MSNRYTNIHDDIHPLFHNFCILEKLLISEKPTYDTV